jgi:hypothetical protein
MTEKRGLRPPFFYGGFFMNNRGVIHISFIVFLLALIGLWFVVKSCQEGKLAENMKLVLDDYKALAMKVAKDEKTKAQVEYLFSQIEKKNNPEDLAKYMEELRKILESAQDSSRQ